MSRKLTLPTDSSVRKDIPLYSGCYTYFPAALAGVAIHSKVNNEKHNPGEPLHHSRGKSTDHADCIARHSMDLADMLARKAVWTAEEQAAILSESRALSWRSLAWAQEIEEMFGAPLAPAARENNAVSKPVPAPIPQGHAWAGEDNFAGREKEPWRVCPKCGGIHNMPIAKYDPGYFDPVLPFDNRGDGALVIYGGWAGQSPAAGYPQRAPAFPGGILSCSPLG